MCVLKCMCVCVSSLVCKEIPDFALHSLTSVALRVIPHFHSEMVINMCGLEYLISRYWFDWLHSILSVWMRLKLKSLEPKSKAVRLQSKKHISSFEF